MIIEGMILSAPAAAAASHGVWDLVAQAGVVVKFVLLLLLAMSVVCWGIIFTKYVHLRRIGADTRVFLENFWASPSFDDIYRDLKKEENASPLARVFRAAYKELVNLQSVRRADGGGADEKAGEDESTLSAAGGGGMENVKRALRRSSVGEIARLERMIPFLATTGSSAPFIGLFGTVWGIMTSFLDISALKSADISVVAPGISEALIATAVGLFAAIPAVIGYNYFVTRIRGAAKELDSFSDDLLNIIERHLPHQR